MESNNIFVLTLAAAGAYVTLTLRSDSDPATSSGYILKRAKIVMQYLFFVTFYSTQQSHRETSWGRLVPSVPKHAKCGVLRGEWWSATSSPLHRLCHRAAPSQRKCIMYK